MRIGAVEAGGTKFVCGFGNEEGVIEDRVSFSTEDPSRTLDQVIGYFRDVQVEAIGVGTFGPINLDPSSPEYGSITTTPKAGWSGYPFLNHLKRELNVAFGWDTDVNAAAYGEAKWGAAQGLNSCLYYTIGTGIGVGIYTEKKLVHDLVHPEGGHMITRRHPDDPFVGLCSYHGDCLEGIASDPAIEKRWHVKGFELAADHPAWEIEAFYLGQAISNPIIMLSPQLVILGGGVMNQAQLFPMIRSHVAR